MGSHRNVETATIWNAREILKRGADVTVRGQTTRELTGVRTGIVHPLERFVFHPGRRVDVFSQIAETMWMLGGRDDVSWLRRYLPRAPQFSDDGIVWRGGYGPRLRDWRGVDQIDEVRRLLARDPDSRRAVISLFDPGRDFTESRDVPCNNWLGWVVRNGRLDMYAALRSNDLWWGFSGTNAFGWSVLQEMLAFWIGARVGGAEYMAMSLHLYDRHLGRAARMVDVRNLPSPYDFGLGRAEFGTPWELFGKRLDMWFQLEAAVATAPEAPIGSHGVTGDPFMDGALFLLHLKWAADLWDDRRLREELATLPDEDWVLAAYERLGRRRPVVLERVPQPSIAAYLGALDRPAATTIDVLVGAIKRLHSTKDRAYGAAWKRRGELVSILPNIARKVDRLEVVVDNPEALDAEAVLDTSVDLLVYACKYCLFIAESLPPGSLLDVHAPMPLTDHERNVEDMLDGVRLVPDGRSIGDVVHAAAIAFEQCWRQAEAGVGPADRLRLGEDLLKDASALVALAAAADEAAVEAMVRGYAER